MIKKLMSFIFEEETIEETPEVVKEKPVEIKEVKMPEKKEARVLDDEKEKSPVVKAAAVSEKKEQSMLNKMKVEPVQAAPAAPKQKKPVITNKIDYEFTPVISPIYGIADEKKVQTTSHVQKKTYTSSSTPTGIVLSPINGNLKEEKPVEEVKPEKVIAEVLEEEVSDAPIVDIPLSSILASNKIDFGDEEPSAAETKEIQNDKKVLLSKNLSLFDDEE